MLRPKDKVSVIVPVYNVEDFLPQCLNSIKRQMYDNLEIILIDDGSTDSCPAILDEFAKNESRAVVIHQPNAGVSAARNKGLEKATGKWIAFVDSDDWLERDYIDRMVDAAELHETKFAFCSLSLENGQRGQISILPLKTGKHTAKEAMPYIFTQGGKGSGIYQGLFDREIIEKEKIRFDENVKRYEDILFYSLYMPQVKEVAVVNHPLYHFNQTPESIKHKYKVYTLERAEHAKYLYTTFQSNLMLYGVDEKVYMRGLKMAYVEFIIKFAANIWNKKNPAKSKDKHEIIKEFIKEYKFHEEIKNFDFGETDPREKLEIGIAKSGSELQLSTYVRGLGLINKK